MSSAERDNGRSLWHDTEIGCSVLRIAANLREPWHPCDAGLSEAELVAAHLRELLGFAGMSDRQMRESMQRTVAQQTN